MWVDSSCQSRRINNGVVLTGGLAWSSAISGITRFSSSVFGPGRLVNRPAPRPILDAYRVACGARLKQKVCFARHNPITMPVFCLQHSTFYSWAKILFSFLFAPLCSFFILIESYFLFSQPCSFLFACSKRKNRVCLSDCFVKSKST